jgi:hypothetical protein
MTHTPHELAHDFPEHAGLIHELKLNEAYFARLAGAYHDLNRDIHRLETRVEPASEHREENLRKKRMLLKDEIAALLAKAAQAIR